jgi:hypothetical protein
MYGRPNPGIPVHLPAEYGFLPEFNRRVSTRPCRGEATRVCL